MWKKAKKKEDFRFYPRNRVKKMLDKVEQKEAEEPKTEDKEDKGNDDE